MDQEQLAALLSGLTSAITSMQASQLEFFTRMEQRSSERSSTPSHSAGNLFLLNFDCFDSTKENFTQYRRRFENYLKMKNLSTNKEMARQLLINSIGAAGYKSMCSIVAPDDPATVDYDVLIDKIEKHLCPKINLVVEQHRFFNCVQSEKQSVADYVSSLKSRILDCQFGCGCKCECRCDDKINDVVLRAQFIRGLADNHTREQLLKIKDISFQAAVDEAVVLEASREQNTEFVKGKAVSTEAVHRVSRRDMSNKSSDHSNSKVRDKNRSKSQNFHNKSEKVRQSNRGYSKNRLSFRELGIENLCVRCGRDNHLQDECKSDKKSLKCSSCSRTGHVAKVCISTLVKNQKNRSSSSNQIETECISNLYDTYNIVEFQNVNLIVDVFQKFDISNTDCQKYYVSVLLKGKCQKFEVDSGAGLTLLPISSFNCLNLHVNLLSTNIRFRSYTGNVFEPLGMVKIPVRYKNVQSEEILFIVPDQYSALLGRAWIRHLKINLQDLDQELSTQPTPTINAIDSMSEIFIKYAKIFEPVIGCIPGVKCSLKLRKRAKPVFIRECPVPDALLKKVDCQLDKLEKAGIIEKVPISDWGSPLVVIPKPDGNVRLCVDYKVAVNQQLEGAHYPIRKIDEVLNSLRNSRYFCRLDLFQAYFHVAVDEGSQEIQTISTHHGTYRMKRLSFGIKTAPSEFNQILDQILSGLEGVSSYFDDILVHGATKDECYSRLISVLDRLTEYDLHLNASKCDFFHEEILFLGHVVKNNQILKDPRKVKAIVDAPPPKNVDQLRQFLGLVTYYSRFIPNYSQRTFPLRQLLKKDKVWKWTASCESAFIALKSEIASDRVIMPFDPKLPVTLACDAGPTGVGAVLSHIVDGKERPVVFISRSLTPAESRYSQLDREALAIVFAVGKLFTYLYGRKFTLITDNRPIVRIFHEKSHIPPMTAARLSRYAVFLSSFDYKIVHRRKEEHGNADYLLRIPNVIASSSVEAALDCEVAALCDQIVNQISTVDITFASIKEATASDPELSTFMQELLNEAKDSEYSLHDGVIFKGSRVVIPKALQPAVLRELHHTHVGVVRMKQLARRYCFWKSIDGDIEALAKGCADCAVVKSSPPKAPIHAWEPPSENFERVHIDYAGEFQGHYFLILVDARSKWLEVKILSKPPTSEITIQLLRDIFSTYGFPRFLVSDNATIFQCSEFHNFCKQAGIWQKFIAPGHPATNGLAERYVQTVKRKLLSLSTVTLSLPEKVREIVFRYRATPLSTGQSPAELYLGRRLRIQLDAMLPPAPSVKTSSTPAVRSLCVGERVQVRWHSGNKPGWRFGKICQKLGKLHYLVELDNGYRLKRHINQLRSTLVPPSEAEPMPVSTPASTPAKPVDNGPTWFDFDFVPGIQQNVEAAQGEAVAIEEPQEAPQELRRSERVRHQPVRFRDYVP